MMHNSITDRLQPNLLDQRVGVVIPVYNRARMLQDTLEFVVAQTRPPEMLVIVDDGSSDDTPDAAEQWLSREQRPFNWQVIRAPHRTASAARNTGFAEIASLPFVAFLDSDDHWPTDFLERTSSLLAQTPDAIAVSTDRQQYNAAGDRWRIDSGLLAIDAVAWLFQNDAGIASCSLFRTDVIQRAGGWNESLESGEDFELFLKAVPFGRWLHAAGNPVSFNRASGMTSGEEGNLSKRRPSMHRDWAIQYEKAYAVICEHDSQPRRDLREGIARKWRDAGIAFLDDGQANDAADAFAAALSWNPFTVGVRVRWVLAKLAAGRERLRAVG